MSVIRVKRARQSGFTTLSHHAVRNPNLSRQARGLLWELCSHGPSYDVTIAGLVEASSDGKHRLAQARVELEGHGYLRVDTTRDRWGHVSGTDWHITDDPSLSPLPESENQIQGSAPESGFLNPDNRIQGQGYLYKGLEVSTKEEEKAPLGSPVSTDRQARVAAKKPIPMPASWEPNERHIKRAGELRLDLAVEAEKFKLHAEANGRVQVNWDAAFTTWLIHADEFGDRRGWRGAARGPVRHQSTVIDGGMRLL